jgi:hypothetical protein
LPTSAIADLWDAISAGAAAESPLWEAALRPRRLQEREPVFSELAEEQYRLGLETIYEGYLLHYGQPRLFAPDDGDTALLLGDYLYAHGLVRIAECQVVVAVADLAELISLCAQVRAEGRSDDGAAWAATSSCLASGELDDARTALRVHRDEQLLLELAREAVGGEVLESALAAHAARVASGQGEPAL